MAKKPKLGHVTGMKSRNTCGLIAPRQLGEAAEGPLCIQSIKDAPLEGSDRGRRLNIRRSRTIRMARPGFRQKVRMDSDPGL